MTTFETLCRICSSPGEYDFFEIIPVYLHGSHNEFLNWQTPINEMVEDTTGLKSARTDGLPNKCCALCISYLKHAVVFRNQTIRNALTLKAIAVIRSNEDKENDKNSLLITEQDLEHSTERQVDPNLLVNQEQKNINKNLLNNKKSIVGPSEEEIQQQLNYVNLLFDKAPVKQKRQQPDNYYYGRQVQIFDTAPGLSDVFGYEDTEAVCSSTSPSVEEELINQHKNNTNVKHNIFSYNETTFREDDIMDDDKLRNIVNVPPEKGFKERKCLACASRFMFDETFQKHINGCIEYKFLTFIEEVNSLLIIRQKKAVSPHEFVRRMIFLLRKLCDWLKEAKCDEIFLPYLNETGQMRPVETPAPNQQKPQTPNSMAAQPTEAAKDAMKQKILEIILCAQAKDNVKKLAKKAASSMKFKNALQTLQSDAPVTLPAAPQTPQTPQTPKTSTFLSQPARATDLLCTPITPLNNILYEIERSYSRSSYSTDNNYDVRSVDEFTAAPVVPTTKISNVPLMKPIAVMATRNADANMKNERAANARTPFMDKLLVASKDKEPKILSHLAMEEEMRSKQKQQNAQTLLEVEQEMLMKHKLERRKQEQLLEKQNILVKVQQKQEQLLIQQQLQADQERQKQEQLQADQERQKQEQLLMQQQLQADQERQKQEQLLIQQQLQADQERQKQKQLLMQQQMQADQERQKQKQLLIQQQLQANRNAKEQQQKQKSKQRPLSRKEMQMEILRQNQLQIQQQHHQQEQLKQLELEKQQLEQQQKSELLEQQTFNNVHPPAQNSPNITGRSGKISPPHSQMNISSMSCPNFVRSSPMAHRPTMQCQPCGIIFETLTDLEMHNAQYHNSKTIARQELMPNIQEEAHVVRNRIIAMFDQDCV